MERILVIGAAGQIGSELVPELRRLGYYTVAAGSGKTPLPKHLCEGPVETVNLLDFDSVRSVVRRQRIDTVFNLAAILSATAESKPLDAWKIGVDGVLALLELARDEKLSVFTPSSIGAFGPQTPRNPTPQDTIQRPTTIYGITKVTGELLGDYYRAKYGVDARSLRYPGLISHVTPPGGGTTDYAVNIYWKAVANRHYTCPLRANTRMPMMFMPDALRAAVELMQADAESLRHFNAFNVAAFSFTPEEIAVVIRSRLPDFTIDYDPDPKLQAIADGWPEALDDTCARNEWGWQPHYSLETMTDIMLGAVARKLEISAESPTVAKTP